MQLKIKKKSNCLNLWHISVAACLFPSLSPLCQVSLCVFREHLYLNSGQSTKAHHKSYNGHSIKSWNLSQKRVSVSVCGRDNTHCLVGPRSVHHSISMRLMEIMVFRWLLTNKVLTSKILTITIITNWQYI